MVVENNTQLSDLKSKSDPGDNTQLYNPQGESDPESKSDLGVGARWTDF